MDHRNRRLSSSPLIDPALCSLVLIAPNQHDLAVVNPSVRNSLQRNLIAAAAAADIMDVPIFMTSPAPGAAKQLLPEHLPITQSHREFFCEEHASPWLNAAFVSALTCEDRSTLLLAVLWLEHQVLATALHTLAESYDVYILVDATPARTRATARLSRERLIQAGATPVATCQVIHEWSLEAADATRRAAMSSILAPLIDR
jgi:Isochorismatase family